MTRLCAVVAAAVLAAALLLSAGSHIAVNANSAQRYWYGRDSLGAYVQGECPLEVKREKLRFDVFSFPYLYDYEGNLSEYNSSVTAEYEFYNPCDYEVNATLVFPFGNMPAYMYDQLENDTARYDITVSGEPVAKKLRHTYLPYYYEFDISEELAKLRDGLSEDGFYSPELKVTAYEFEFCDIPTSDKYAPYASFVAESLPGTRYMISDYNGSSWLSDTKRRIGKFVHSGDKVTVYAIGKPLAVAPSWTVYENGEEKKKISGSAKFVDISETTFWDIAMKFYDPDGEVSATDWYNAIVYGINLSSDLITGVASLDIKNVLMRWYEYDICVPPQSSIVNTITAPLYPAVDGEYSPAVYDYTYLLSPAGTWAAFGTLEVEIVTPYYMIRNNHNLEPQDCGYGAKFDSLPDGELTFSLCADPEPSRIKSPYSTFVRGVGIIFAIVFAVSISVAIAIIAVYLIKDVKRKKA